MMPRWTAGQIDGKNVGVQIDLPIKLRYNMVDGKLKKINTDWIDTKELDNTKITFKKIETLPELALYFVDGKEMSAAEVSKIAPEKIESMTVFKDDEIPKEYGEKGKNGVILLTLKKEYFVDGKAPLYIIDGKEFTGDITTINPGDIATTTVLKNETAINLYGEKGKNGVVLITLKKGNN